MDISASAEGSSHSLIERVKDATLKYSGLSYLIGDAALFAYGITDKNKKSRGAAFTGLTWGAGGLALAIYGKQSQEYQLKRLSEDLGHYFQAQGVSLPKDNDLSRATLESRGIMQAFERFMYDHPSQVLNAVYAFGSLGLMKDGLSQSTRNPWKAASGMLVCAGGLSGLLLPEKEARPDETTASLLADPVGWIHEKPLRLSGALYSLNNITLAKSGFDEMRKNPADKRYLYIYLTVASYVVANTLLGLSHKDRDNQANTLPLEELERAAAEVIASQPAEVQDALLQDVANYLSERKQVSQSVAELAEALKAQVAALTTGTPVQQARHEGTLSTVELTRS